MCVCVREFDVCVCVRESSVCVCVCVFVGVCEFKREFGVGECASVCVCVYVCRIVFGLCVWAWVYLNMFLCASCCVFVGLSELGVSGFLSFFFFADT